MPIGTRRTDLFLKRPAKEPGNGRRRTFAIVKRILKDDGTVQNLAFPHPTLTEINTRLLAGKETLDQATAQANRLLKTLQSELKGPSRVEALLPENESVVEAYWKAEYEGRDLRDPDSMSADLNRAVRALGNVSLKTADAKTLQRKVDELQVATKQRRVVARLNQLLRFLERGIRLKKKRKPHAKVAHIRLADLPKLLACVPGATERSLVGLAFYSGLRLGELFALEKRQLKGAGTLFVDQQVSTEWEFSAPKRDKSRNAAIHPEGMSFFRHWLDVPLAEKKRLRKMKWSDLVRGWCAKAFPTEPEKWIKFHDLRHSYAIMLLDAGVHINDVALSLGDGIQVTQDHYAGFLRETSHTEAIISKLKR